MKKSVSLIRNQNQNKNPTSNYNKNTNLKKISNLKIKKPNVSYKKDGIIIIDKIKNEKKPIPLIEDPCKIIIKNKINK